MVDESALQSKRCPIDFDHDSSAHAADWPGSYQTLRDQCPRAWTESHGGYWVATRYRDILSVAQNKEAFYTGKTIDTATGEINGGVMIPPLPFRVAPHEIDLPEWQGIRSFLNRHLSPKAVDALRPKALSITTGLIDEVIELGTFDIVDSLASPMPALMTMALIGFPADQWEIFSDAFHRLVYLPKDSPEHSDVLKSFETLRVLIDEGIEERRTHPKEDLMSYLVHGTIDGEPIAHERIVEMISNVLGGGIDTTTALTSNALLYLARHPEERQRLIENPAALPLACEEFVRYFSPIQGLARNAQNDVTIDGWTVAGGERVLLAYASANRDPEVFEDPEQVKLDRYPNRHIGFGAGMHRCIGSFLARMMFETMVSQVLERMPDYRIEEDKIAAYTSVSIVNGWIRVPATFTPGSRIGSVAV